MDNDTVVMTADYTYDILDRLTNVSFDSGASSVSYTYDANGNVLTETKNGNVTEYAYNKAGLLKAQTGGESPDYTMTYSLDGNKVGETDSVNGYRSYVYDGIGQLKSETQSNNGIVSNSISYTYDTRGNRISSNNDGTICNYTYDRNNRLINDDNGIRTNSYAYDKNGNMVSRLSGTYIDSDKAVAENMSINVFGESANQASDISNSTAVYYTYDAVNKLKSVQSDDGMTASYVYDAKGRRISKTVNGITTTQSWGGDYIIREKDSTGTESARYYRGRNLVANKTNGTVNYYYYDPHGSVASIGGKTYTYDAFGNQTNDNANDTNTFRYCGEYFDNETGYIYLRARYYDPSTGRFTTEDPIKDGLNWYVYCNNNPVKFVDPSGLEYLVVSGSEYDGIPKINSRYKYNFIEPAITKLKELKSLEDGQRITWVVSATAYTDEALHTMNTVASDMGVNIQFIESAAQLQNYINSQDINIWELSRTRLSDPIKKFVVFSHGVIGRVELGHNLYNNRSLCIDFDFIQGMFSEAFDNPNSAFYSCRTGVDSTNQWGSNLAQNWVNRVGGRTWAATSRTDYAYILDGEGNIGQLNREKYGFNINGSPNLPIASGGESAWMNFYRPEWFINW